MTVGTVQTWWHIRTATEVTRGEIMEAVNRAMKVAVSKGEVGFGVRTYRAAAWREQDQADKGRTQGCLGR